MILGAGTFFLSWFASVKLEYGDALCEFLSEKTYSDIAWIISVDVCSGVPTAFAGAAGWKIGEWLCKKIGLED